MGDSIISGVYESVHSRYGRVVNFTSDDAVISVVDEFWEPGPYRIALRGVDFEQLRKLEVEPQRLVIDDEQVLPVRQDKVFRSLWQPAEDTNGLPLERISALEELLVRMADASSLVFLFSQDEGSGGFDGAFRAQMRSAYALLLEGKVFEAVEGFRGRGYGSTPSGDDFNAGLLLGLGVRDVLEKKELSKSRSLIYTLSLGKNLLVNTFLCQAYSLRPNRDWRRLLSRLLEKDELLSADISPVLEQGASSGADTLAGFVSAWKIKL